MSARTTTARAAARAVAALLLVAPAAGCDDDHGTPVAMTPSPGREQREQAAPAGPLAQLSTPQAPPTAAAPAPGTDPSTGSDADWSVGGVVDGFPTDLLPPYPGAQVLVTSASEPSGSPGRLEVSLAGRTPDAAEDVVAHHRRALTAAGFAEAPPAGAPEEVLAAVFTRSGGTEVVSVAVVDTGVERRFTVGGTLAAPSP